MNLAFWQSRKDQPLAGLLRRLRDRLDQWLPLLSFPAPESRQLLRRIAIMERDIILPLKVAGIAMLCHSFYARPWVKQVLTSLDVAVESMQFLLAFYIGANVLMAIGFLAMRRLPLPLVQWNVYTSCLMDGLLLSALTLVTGGYQSFLYWFFLPLIVRSSFSVPRATSQLLLNVSLCFCYVVAGSMEIAIAGHLAHYEQLQDIELQTGGLTDRADRETLVLRTFVLLLMTACSYGVQILLERQRLALEEAREFAVREGQLRSAGRMAAEFVHSIKNPLAIINTTAYSLQRSLKDGQPEIREKVRIIQEEVERSDRIITQVMGYAQLSEGRVEKLDVVEELEAAIARVLPPGVEYPITVHRDYAAGLSPLLMQRRHLSETFINILQNAREALGARGGNIHVSAQRHGFDSVAVSIRDDGPGIPKGKHEQIFEAYYTTREKGTGLGLATAKHNVELYGGKIRVESELGKGACFTLLFPARALLDVNLHA